MSPFHRDFVCRVCDEETASGVLTVDDLLESSPNLYWNCLWYNRRLNLPQLQLPLSLSCRAVWCREFCCVSLLCGFGCHRQRRSKSCCHCGLDPANRVVSHGKTASRLPSYDFKPSVYSSVLDANGTGQRCRFYLSPLRFKPTHCH